MAPIGTQRRRDGTQRLEKLGRGHFGTLDWNESSWFGLTEERHVGPMFEYVLRTCHAWPHLLHFHCACKAGTGRWVESTYYVYSVHYLRRTFSRLMAGKRHHDSQDSKSGKNREGGSWLFAGVKRCLPGPAAKCPIATGACVNANRSNCLCVCSIRMEHRLSRLFFCLCISPKVSNLNVSPNFLVLLGMVVHPNSPLQLHP